MNALAQQCQHVQKSSFQKIVKFYYIVFDGFV